VRNRVAEKVADIEQRIADLKAIRQALKKLADSCSSSGPADQCPILKHLEREL